MKPSLVLLLSVFPQSSETFIVYKFLGLVQAGWDVHIVCGRFSQRDWDTFEALRTHPELRTRVHRSLPADVRWLAGVYFLPVFLYTFLKAPKEVLQYLRKCWKLHRWETPRYFYLDAVLIRLRPQIIHFEFGALAIGRETLGECLGCKMVVSFRGYDLNFSGLDNPSYYEKVWRAADGLHLLGQDLWLRALRRGCPPSKLHALIPPALDAGYFQRPSKMLVEEVGSPERPLRILSVGRLEWKKGYEFALQALKELQRRNIYCEYHMVGSGQYLGALAFACHQLGLEKRVQMMGGLPREQVKLQYEWADLFLHAAVSEGFCNAVVEAQAMEIPVVTTDAGGLSENVENRVTGYVVSRRNPLALADKMEILARDPQLRLALGSAGRRRVLVQFRIEQQITAFDHFYHAVAGGAM